MSDYTITRPGHAIAEPVLEAIAQRAAEEVDGVTVAERRVRRGRDVTVGVRGERLAVALSVSIRYGVVLPEAAEQSRQRVAALHAEIARLQSENAQLRAEIDSVRKSTYAVERIAREDLGMSRKGEVVYMLPHAGR